MADIHPSAIVEDGAELGRNVSIGAYSIVGAEAVLGDDVTLHPHVVVAGRTQIGANTEIFPFASIGHRPQDLKYAGEPSRLVIGANNVIREHVTMNPGTSGGVMETVVGDHGLFMIGAHVAHDCRIGDHVIMANNATLAGHVEIGDFAILGGLSAVHQFVRIGAHAMIGGMSGVEFDVIPYGMAMGERATLNGLNVVGMKRRGFTRENIGSLRSAYRALFDGEGTFAEALSDVSTTFKDEAVVADLIEFLKFESSRGFCRPRKGNAS